MQEPILRLQQELRLLAAMDDRYMAPAADGVYGEETARAIQQFQQLSGLPVTGEADTVTAQAVHKVYAQLSEQIADPQPICPFPSPYFVIEDGESGPLIHILQAMLTEVGSDFAIQPPDMTGHYDAATRSHVIRWQQAWGIPVTGKVDRSSWDRLADLYNMRLL